MLEIKYRDIKGLKKLPNNPRVIKDKQFEILCHSIQTNPLYFEARPILLSDRTGEMIIIAGNQRFEAAKQVGLTRVPTILFSKISEEKEREIIIRDNVQNGEWDTEMLANDWNLQELLDWGVEIPNFELDPDKLGDEFNLKDGEKPPFQEMTFTVADQQAEFIKNALAEVKETEEFKWVETFANENSNGNALYLIIQQWKQKK